MKYAIVGTSHAGYEAAQTILEAQPDAEINLYEAGSTASFLSCGIQSYLEGESESLDDLHYANEASYKEQGINIMVNTEVVSFDGDAKTVTVKTPEGERTDDYDKLILSPGAIPTPLPVDGVDAENVFYLRGRDWAQKVHDRMKDAKKVVVVGGGYIGIEAAEAYALAGIDTTVIDFQDRILPTYLDEEFTDILTKNAESHGLTFHGGEGVQSFETKDSKVSAVVTDKNTYEADTVIVSIGIKPNTKWLEGLVDMDQKGFIEVNEKHETSVKDVYAAGDATLVPFSPTGKKVSYALASTARRQGIVAAKNALGEEATIRPVSGTSGLHLFDYEFSTSGIKDSNADWYDGEVDSKYVTARLRPTFFTELNDDNNTVYMQINFDKESHVVLGAQFISKGSVGELGNIMSVVIDHKMTLEELEAQDFFFQPEFDGPWHPINVLAMQALGRTYGSDKMLFM
ncbi:FAD-dependent oxidoreductase [Aerococcus urinae]|uniref:FAD-dependent oxidoreductase n=1 Tax=Aerococcus urinae TaxID=1376 RepID=UPI00254DB89A|nr:FAD-dependent oxidoreductase [Aerococcus urinae]MDK6520111.1 FAD-dependent oxidoreductase [Aerococcus urinae]